MTQPHIESAEAGYRLALSLHAERVAAGWKPTGRKIGFTNRSIWPRYGVYQPIFGFVYDRTVIDAPGNVATVKLAALPLAIDAASFTVKLNTCVASASTPLWAVMMMGYVPPVPAAGVPLRKPALLSVTPVGSVPNVRLNVEAG